MKIETKTVKELIQLLQEWPEDTKIYIRDWNQYSDTPWKRGVTEIYPVETKTTHKLKEILL